MYRYIAKEVKNGHMGSSTDSCCIQNQAVMNLVLKRTRARLFKTNDVVS